MPHLVVHGHFYQPPRENPWTEVIDRQPSAAPFHDWNERVSAECYERIGSAIVRAAAAEPGAGLRIGALVNLWSRLSFNIGPTLAAWLAVERPEVLAAAQAGDREARTRTGSGNALMQPFGHAILPLCTPRERRLQLIWGRADFRARFDREPEGIWLSECAVDIATLEDCVACGLSYTIVAPEQIARIRPLSGGAWRELSSEPAVRAAALRRPLLVRLPSGASITLFVFDGALSRGVAFSRLLSGDGEQFLKAAQQTVGRGDPGSADDADQALLLVACDGETFGHHQPGAEESLAGALQRARLRGELNVAHLGQIWRTIPATHEAQLVEPSSWSCPHGVARWSRDCGCGLTGAAGGSHAWREPLRRAISQLQGRVFALVDRHGGEFLREPWESIEAYGALLALPPDHAATLDFAASHAAPGADATRQQGAVTLLELVRQTLFSATSCGWFFEDLSGIEAIQVMRHAARTAELCRHLLQVDPEPDLCAALAAARSNAAPPVGVTGEALYRQQALTAKPTAGALAARVGLALPAPAGDRSLEQRAEGRVGAYHVVLAPSADRAARGVDRSRRFQADVVHERTGERSLLALELTAGDALGPIAIQVDGEPLEPQHDPALAESVRHEQGARLQAAWREIAPRPIDALLAATEQLVRSSRGGVALLPPPLGELLAGAGRAQLESALSLGGSLPELGEALRRLSGCELPPEARDVWIRPVGAALLHHGERVLAAGDSAALVQFQSVLLDARRAIDERCLVPLWQRLLALPPCGRREDRERLAVAGGLSPDALTPLDTPARPPDPQVSDALA